MNFQELIFSLERFWANQGCVIRQPYDMEVGAGTFHPAFWILSAMISFVASVSLTVDFPPPSMIPFVFVAYGLMVLIVAVARIMVGDTSGRQRR